MKGDRKHGTPTETETETETESGTAPRQTRREFLVAGAALGAASAMGCGGGTSAGDGGAPLPDAPASPLDAFVPPDAPTVTPVDPPEPVPESAEFALGVASGDATPSSAVLWTRY